MQWVSHLNFEETVKGCLVMLNMAQNSTTKYLVAKIKDLVEKAEYYNVDGMKDINKYLVLEVEGSEREFPIKFVSNSEADEMALKIWLDDCNKRHQSIMTLQDVKDKEKLIKDNLIKKYTANQIAEHVEKKLGGGDPKGRQTVHPQERLYILQDKLQNLIFQQFSNAEKLKKDPAGKRKLQAQLDQTKKSITRLQHELRFSTHIDTHNMTNIPTRNTELLTGHDYLEKKDREASEGIFKKPLLDAKPLWVIREEDIEEELAMPVSPGKAAKGEEPDDGDPHQGLYEDNIDVRNQFLKAFKVKLNLDDAVERMEVSVVGWD
jgi:hypothetical protein